MNHNKISTCLLMMIAIVVAAACNSETTGVAPTEPALAMQLPGQSLLLLCDESGTDTDAFSLIRYDLGTHEWTPELNGRMFNRIFALPEQDVLLLEVPEDREAPLEAILSRQGEEQFLFDTAAFATDGQTDPAGRWLVVYQQRPFRSGTPAMLDLSSCAQTECAITPLAGIPTWSPDGQQTLLNDTTYTPEVDTPQGFHVGNGQGETLTQISQTSVVAPFWLDAETYGYLRAQLEFEVPEDVVVATPTELVVSSVTTHEPRILLKSEDLWSLQPDENFPLSFYTSAAPVPGNAEQLVIRATAYNPEAVKPTGPGLTAGNQRQQLWQLQTSTGELSLLLEADDLSRPRFSPDGRWLLIGEYVVEEQSDADAPPDVQTLLHFFDLQSNWQHTSIDTFPDALTNLDLGQAADWTADGQWLFVVGSNQLQTIAPAENQLLTMPLPVKGCHQLALLKENAS